MVILDRFVIGAITGANSVAYYTVPFQLSNRTTLIPGSLATALFPRLAGIDSSERQRLMVDALKILLVVMTPVVVVGIFFIELFCLYGSALALL